MKSAEPGPVAKIANHSYKLPRFSEQRKRFRSSLDGSGFDATGAVAHALLGDQYEQTVELVLTIGAPVTIPGDAELERVLEA